MLSVAGHLAGGNSTEVGGRDPAGGTAGGGDPADGTAGGEDLAGGATGGKDARGCIVMAEVLEAAAFLVILPDLLHFTINSWVQFSQVGEALSACGTTVAQDCV